MEFLFWFLFINLFNHFPKICSMENTLIVEIQRSEMNPEYDFLYSNFNEAPMKLELYPLHDWNWNNKKEALWKVQIEENNIKFDKFTFEQLPNEWIYYGYDFNLDPVENGKKFRETLLELRIELIDAKEIRFRTIRLKETQNNHHLWHFSLRPMLEKEWQNRMPVPKIKMELKMDDLAISHSHLVYAKIQFGFCMKTLEEIFKILTENVTKESNEPKQKIYLMAEAYRDLQWQIYNVQKLHLNELEKIFHNGVLEVNDKFKEFEKELPKIKQEMDEYKKKMLGAQEDYITARKGNKQMPILYKSLLDKGKPLDDEANILNEKIMDLQNLIIEMPTKQDANAVGSSRNAGKRKMPPVAGSPRKKHAKLSSSSHKGSTDSERTISD